MLKYTYYILLCLLITFAACTHNTTEESKKPRETEIPLAFNFSSTIPPPQINWGAVVLKSFNTVSVNSARQNHEDSATVFIDEDSMAANKKVPVYEAEDIYFSPVLNKDSLEQAFYGSFDKKNDRDHAATIDFNRYFTLVVTHPPSGNLYLDVLSQQDIPGDTLRLSLSSTAAPMPAETAEAMGANTMGIWFNGVYKLQKQKYKVLAVDYKAHTHFFKLK